VAYAWPMPTRHTNDLGQAQVGKVLRVNARFTRSVFVKVFCRMFDTKRVDWHRHMAVLVTAFKWSFFMAFTTSLWLGWPQKEGRWSAPSPVCQNLLQPRCAK